MLEKHRKLLARCLTYLNSKLFLENLIAFFAISLKFPFFISFVSNTVSKVNMTSSLTSDGNQLPKQGDTNSKRCVVPFPVFANR